MQFEEYPVGFVVAALVWLGGWAIFGVCWFLGRRNKSNAVMYADIPLPGVSDFDGRDVSCTCEGACVKHEIQPESMIIGSNFTKIPVTKIPKVQVPLYSVDENGRLVSYLGAGVRIMDWFVVPIHVIVPYETIAVLIQRPGQLAESVKLEVAKFDLIEGDIAVRKLSEATFSRFGLMKAKLSPLEGDTLVSICSSSKDPEISFGTMINDKYVFGHVLYRGSTKGGFSGAAYMVGNMIAGIHLGGGVNNYGVNATYIQALLQKPEETAEWLQRIRKSRGPLKFQRSRNDPDEIQVWVGNRYITVDRTVLEEEDTEENRDEVIQSHTVNRGGYRVPEVNVGENFPPQYRDVADDIVTTVNAVKQDLHPLNLKAAEVEPSATEAEAYLAIHAESVAKIDEKMMLLQSLIDSTANRYREVEKLMVQMVKGTEGRAVLVTENEKLKKELTELKMLKTSANVDLSSLKAVPNNIRKAKSKGEKATMLDSMAAQGFKVDAVIRMLVELGLVQKVVEEPAVNVETTTVLDGQKPSTSSIKQLPSISPK